jgi:hypothetical protein
MPGLSPTISVRRPIATAILLSLVAVVKLPPPPPSTTARF